MALPATGKFSSQRTQFKETRMEQAQNGDTVKVHYTGTLDDGTIFDTSVGRDPLEFTLGERQVIPGFEQAVVGMSPGESKTAEISADEAYGPHNEEMVVSVDRSDFPNSIEPRVGQMLQLHQPSGQRIAVTVTEVSEASVTLDANHPLAGKDLTFDIQLVEIM
jgi:peptidylprolyl isomerase